MTEMILAALDGIVLSSRDTVRVIARAHPLRAERLVRDLPAGLSIAELLAEVLGDDVDHPLIVDLVDDRGSIGIERGLWARVRPKPGTVLTARPRLQKGALRLVLTVALAVAALVVSGGFAAPLLGTAFAAGTFGAAALGAGIVLAGTLAINALFPIRPPQLSNPATEAFQSLPSIAGARNQAAPFAPVPALLGKHRVSPFYGAKPYTELVGDDQYQICLFVWGIGPISVDQSTFKIGETLLSSFNGVTVEHRAGLPADTAITTYPTAVDEQALSVTLTDARLPGTQGPEDDWASRNTAIDADVISLDVTAPDGIYQISTADGSVQDWTVSIEWRWRKVGNLAWTQGTTFAFYRSLKTQRIGARVATPSRAQYQVEVRKASPDGTNFDTSGRIHDTVVWTALRSFTNRPPVNSPVPLCMTALRIKATDQLNGSIDTFNGIATALVNAYNGAAWVANTASSSPADLFRSVLQGKAIARPVADALIALDNLASWWSYCNTQGFTFNQYRSSVASVYDTLADIAAAGRAVPTFIDGKWGVIWDRPADPIVQHFTPRNSWGFQGSKPYAHLPHGWRVKFINATNGYTQDERIVYDDGYDANNATLFEALEFPGVNDPALIWRHGRFHIAQSRLRPEDISLSVGWENLVCTRGDRVAVTHDVLLIGQISGRVKTIVGQAVTVDETVTLAVGKTYGFVFRNAATANRSIVRAVDAAVAAGEYAAGSSILLVGDLTVIDADALWGFGETDRETANYRVKSIRHQKDLIATLILVDDAPDISTADTGAIPAYNPNVTLPVDPFTLPPQQLQYIEFIAGFGQNATANVRLSWTLPRKGKVAAFEVQNRDDNNDALWHTVASVPWPTTSYDVPLIASGLWSYRVRCLFEDGTASDWATLPTLNLEGLLSPPDEVANYRSTYNQATGRVYLTWDATTNDNRGILYEIRKGASWDAGLLVGEAITQPKFETVGDDTYWIAAYVITPFGLKVYSATKHSLALAGSVLTQNVVVSRDEKATGWTGYFGGTVGRDDDLGYLRTSGSNSFLGEADMLGIGSMFAAGVQGGGYYRSKIIVDAGREMPCRVSVDYSATGVPVAADFLNDPDFLNNPDFLQSYLTQFIRVYPVIRVGSATDPDAFAPSDIFAEDDAFAAGITWGAWQKWSPDVYVGRFYQLGLVFEILDTSVGAIAYGLAFSWVVDVTDRLDRYQNLTVPIGGLPIAFTPTGSDTATPFKGGIDNEPLPHILTDYVDRPTGYAVRVTNLTLAGCTVAVVNAAGTDVGGTGINLMAQGYG